MKGTDFKFGWATYFDHLLDQVVHAAVRKDLPLRCHRVKQNVKGCILVRSSPLVVRTVTSSNQSNSVWVSRVTINSSIHTHSEMKDLPDHFVDFVHFEIGKGVAAWYLPFKRRPDADGHPDFVIFIRAFQASHGKEVDSNWFLELRFGKVEGG